MSSSTADALGLSRAILCNDSLVKKLEELERTEFMYTGLIDHTRKMLRAYFDVFLVFKGKGENLVRRQWATINYVDRILDTPFFDEFITKLCSIIDIWLPSSSLACQRKAHVIILCKNNIFWS